MNAAQQVASERALTLSLIVSTAAQRATMKRSTTNDDDDDDEGDDVDDKRPPLHRVVYLYVYVSARYYQHIFLASHKKGA